MELPLSLAGLAGPFECQLLLGTAPHLVVEIHQTALEFPRLEENSARGYSTHIAFSLVQRPLREIYLGLPRLTGPSALRVPSWASYLNYISA